MGTKTFFMKVKKRRKIVSGTRQDKDAKMATNACSTIQSGTKAYHRIEEDVMFADRGEIIDHNIVKGQEEDKKVQQ